MWLVRHAAVQIEAGICYGRLDVPADAEATAQTARALADALPEHVAHLTVSPRRRCVQLADALCALRPQLRPRIDPRLAEMDFGSWEGQRWDAIGAAALDAWSADFGTCRPGGGERVNDFLARVGAAFDDAAALARQTTAMPGTNGKTGETGETEETGDSYDIGDATVWITHAGVARAALLWQGGKRSLSYASEWPREGLDFGRWQQTGLSPGLPPGRPRSH